MCQSKVGELVMTPSGASKSLRVLSVGSMTTAAPVLSTTRMCHRHDLSHRLELGGYHDDVVKVRLHVVDRGEVGQQPCGVLLRRERLGLVGVAHVGVAGIAGEVEHPDIEALLVDRVDKVGRFNTRSCP